MIEKKPITYKMREGRYIIIGQDGNFQASLTKREFDEFQQVMQNREFIKK